MDQTVDIDSVSQFLSKKYGSEASGSAMPLGSGGWSHAFSFHHGGRDLVARFGNHREDFVKDQKVAIYSRPDLPIPVVLEVGEALGGFYAISERHFGMFLEALDEYGWRTLLPSLMNTLDALRQIEFIGGIDWSGESAESSTGWRQWLVDSLEDQPSKRVSGWRTELHKKPESEKVFASGEQVLSSLLSACPEHRYLLHRDMLNRNVMVSTDASRVEALFDWGCSLAGDFLYEVAWFTFWSPWFPAMQALDFRKVILDHYEKIGLLVEHFDERLRCYELHIGLEHIAYAAFTRHESDLESVTKRTIPLLRLL